MRAKMAVAAALVATAGLLVTAAHAQPPADAGDKGDRVAEAKPLDRAELDRRIARVVNDAVGSGVTLWDAGNTEGAYRLYQGTLAAVVPLLDHRPALQTAARYKLRQGSGLRPVEGAFVLRSALDEIQKETAEALVVKPLWDRLGGEKGVRAVVKDFVEAAAADPRTNLSRGGKYKLDENELARLQSRVTEGISVVTKGPLKYMGFEAPVGFLAGLGLTAAEFDALTGHLSAALKKNKVPEAESGELLKYAAVLRVQPGMVK